jgi:hypothetical protein
LVRRVSTPSDRIAIIGAGASTLVGALVDEGYVEIACVDIALAALDALRIQLGERCDAVRYICSNVLGVAFDPPVALWHDRATFHFFTEPADQAAYISAAAASIVPGGSLVMAAFAPEGPTRCSDLDVQRWSADDLAHAFGDAFDLADHFEHLHVTPWGSEQRFTYVVLTRR